MFEKRLSSRKRRTALLVLFCGGLLCLIGGTATAASFKGPYVPNSWTFWSNSTNWTTTYGPAFRDTYATVTDLVPCTGNYALCADVACKLRKYGRNCDAICSIQEGVNWISAESILNASVGIATRAACADGSCLINVDSAPVCQAIKDGTLNPGADLISTFSNTEQATVAAAINSGLPSGVTICPKAPYAACMTAPCKIRKDGSAKCECPVFDGKYNILKANAQCTLGGDLVPSSGYLPELDNLPSR